MRVKQRLFERLDNLEKELRELLVPALRRVADGRDGMFFFTPLTNPFPEEGWISSHLSSSGTRILKLAHEILRLASQLGESPDDLFATKVVGLFNYVTNSSDDHIKSSATLSRDFLRDIGESAH